VQKKQPVALVTPLQARHSRSVPLFPQTTPTKKRKSSSDINATRKRVLANFEIDETESDFAIQTLVRKVVTGYPAIPTMYELNVLATSATELTRGVMELCKWLRTMKTEYERRALTMPLTMGVAVSLADAVHGDGFERIEALPHGALRVITFTLLQSASIVRASVDDDHALSQWRQQSQPR
jgi:hypothetical protein